MIQLHESLVKETQVNWKQKANSASLTKGSGMIKRFRDFKSAVPLAEKLGKAENQKIKLSSYSQLVEMLATTVGHHDKSNANLFYCPMVKRNG